MASGVENVYVLGSEGVNVVDSPLHLKNGEVTQAQNAAFPTDKGQGGLGMRGGLARINSAAMSGSIAGVINVPLPAPGAVTRSLLLGLGSADTDTFSRSTDGTTWVEGATPTRPVLYSQTTAALSTAFPLARALTVGGRILYPGSDFVQYPAASHTGPTIRVYDGVTDALLARVPFNPNAGATTNAYLVIDTVMHLGRVFVCTYDHTTGEGGSFYGRVFELDPDNGELTQIGPAFTTAFPWCLASHNGLLWVGMSRTDAGGVTGYLYSFRVDVDSAWTLRHTTAITAGPVLSAAAFQGVLYFGTRGTDAQVGRVWALASNYGSAASSDAGASNGAYSGLVVFDGSLYAFYGESAGVSTIRVFNGSAWSTDLDVGAVESLAYTQFAQFFVDTYNDVLYAGFAATGGDTGTNGFLYRKPAGGAWSRVVHTINSRGLIGRIDVPS